MAKENTEMLRAGSILRLSLAKMMADFEINSLRPGL